MHLALGFAMTSLSFLIAVYANDFHGRGLVLKYYWVQQYFWPRKAQLSTVNQSTLGSPSWSLSVVTLLGSGTVAVYNPATDSSKHKALKVPNKHKYQYTIARAI